MAQMTWRASDDLLARVRGRAAESGRSLNEWVTLVLDAATDPATSGSEATEVRERLARAGLLAAPAPARGGSRAAPARLSAARAAAGRGTTPSQLVRDGR